MYDPVEEMECEADTIYREEIEYELARNMSTAFVDATPAGNLRMAALSIVTARWDSVRRDVKKGRLSQIDAFSLLERAVNYKILVPQMAEHQMRLIKMQGCSLCGGTGTVAIDGPGGLGYHGSCPKCIQQAKVVSRRETE